MKINELKVFTGQIIEQRQFYTELLGFREIDFSGSELSYRVGDSILKFSERKSVTPYHFAFNIYSNQENEALDWLKERVPILPDGKNEIQDFASWNSKAIYFYDREKNIVEFIARKNLSIEKEGKFNRDSLIEISEIGLPVNKIEYIFNRLNSRTGVEIYSGTFEEFCAIGDEQGLFICVNKNTKLWFPVFDKAYASDFSALITNQNKQYKVDFQNGILTITSE